VGLVLAPHYSALSVGEYAARAAATPAVTEGRVELTMVESWHLAPGYIELLAERVVKTLELLVVTDPDRIEVVFTAHSLPERILDLGDPYPRQLEETASAVAERAGVGRWSVAWQSAGRTPESWIGPDLLSVLEERARAGVEGVLVCPAGFVSDHLEILYDLDIEARQVAERLGLAFARTESPNDEPRFCATLAEVVRSHAAGASPAGEVGRA
jgi:ferrochelatase